MAARFDPQRELGDDGVLVSKVCSGCGERREAGAYQLDAKNADGRKGVCKTCLKLYWRRRRSRGARDHREWTGELMTGATFRAVHEVWPMLPASSGLPGFDRRYGRQYG